MILFQSILKNNVVFYIFTKSNIDKIKKKKLRKVLLAVQKSNSYDDRFRDYNVLFCTQKQTREINSQKM